MKFFCNTYHQERDESLCGFCSAACGQYDRFNKKIMKKTGSRFMSENYELC